MHAADFLIGKPGPGSIAEAVTSGLPVLLECNSSTLPQERYNTEWVTEKQVGAVVKHFKREIVGAVQAFLEPGRLQEMKRNVGVLDNRAVFEIPEFLSSLLSEKEDRVEELPAAKVVG
jgi:1,2-diacylglycerol 3-beta-galactosyltransferase